MVNKQSLSSRRYWASIPKEERSRRMRELAHKRHRALTPLQRKRIARKLVNARKAKRAG